MLEERVVPHVLRSKLFEKNLERVPEFIRAKVFYWIIAVESFGIKEVRKHDY